MYCSNIMVFFEVSERVIIQYCGTKSLWGKLVLSAGMLGNASIY